MYETLDMSGLPDYTVGGCIHLVVNNQVRGVTAKGGSGKVTVSATVRGMGDGGCGSTLMLRRNDGDSGGVREALRCGVGSVGWANGLAVNNQARVDKECG